MILYLATDNGMQLHTWINLLHGEGREGEEKTKILEVGKQTMRISRHPIFCTRDVCCVAEIIRRGLCSMTHWVETVYYNSSRCL